MASLSDFSDAKEDLQNIYQNLSRHLQQVLEQLAAIPPMECLLSVQVLEQLRKYIAKVKEIDAILQRKRMKVAFFGRTSNGKSAVINAMLHAPILPSAMGHTTSCFCQVEASAAQQEDSCDPYVLIEDATEKLSISSLRALASAHSVEALNPRTLLHVCWPREHCALLAHDVVLLDTPGVDVTAQLDDCLDRHCLNADVFVLVLNAESTMARVEKQFFHEVASKLSRPNVFILNNRWDAAAQEWEIKDLVREQHTQRCVELLVNELGIYETDQQARKRIYFISAREALRIRLDDSKFKLAPGHEQRYAEFLSFEQEFAQCISQSALRTKFQQHCAGAVDLLKHLQQMLSKLQQEVAQKCADKWTTHALLTKSFECRELQIMQMQQEMSSRIEQFSDEAAQKSVRMLHEQISQLAKAVQEFSCGFRGEAQRGQLNLYQRALNLRLEQILNSQVQMQICTPLELKVQQLESELVKTLPPLLWQQMQQLQQPGLQLLYFCDCQAIMANFQADLEFRFSWGIVAMLQRFQHKAMLPQGAQRATQSLEKSLNGMRHVQPSLAMRDLNTEQLKTISAFLLKHLGAEGFVSCLCLGSYLMRCIGWRPLLAVCGLFGSVYLYELLSWTTAAQERSYKLQYTRYLLRMLRGGVQQISSGFGQQIKRHLLRSLREMCLCLEQAKVETSTELEILQKEVELVKKRQLELKLLEKSGHTLELQLASFTKKYLVMNERGVDLH